MLFVWWSIALLAIFLIGVTKSGFGSGVGLMIVPMMALSMSHVPERGTEAALGMLLPLLVAGDLIAVYQYRHLFSMKIVRKLLPGTLLGVVIGMTVLWWFATQEKEVADALIRIEIGLESMLLVGLHWWRSSREKDDGIYQPKAWQSAVVGAFAGASSTIAHAAGPIITLYLLPQRLERQLYVGTNALYFFLLNTIKLPAYYQAGQFAKASPQFSLMFLPVVIAGAFTGIWLNRRVSDALFSKIVYALTFVLGLYVPIDGGIKLGRHL